MPRSVRLRPWQKAALERYRASAGPDFLAVATPGAGKTTFALTAAVGRLAAPAGPGRLVVVAPTAHLKGQWTRAAAAFGLHLDPAWSPATGPPAPDMHGLVTTYQQVASAARALRALAPAAMVVFDEIHHAGDERAWGDAIRHAFEPAPLRLALSGTPFRSDTRAIPFVRYELDEARPDFEYGYGEALADGRVVRPVFFPRTGGSMEWTAPDGSLQAATFDDPLDRARANQRLRTALSLDGDWLPAVLRAAHERLVELRQVQPDAGGLVIATDQDHARGIATTLERRFGAHPVVATSDDAAASARIARFAGSDAPWLVAVRMVSEGVDIPRLRVGVYATTTTTELFFRQAVGRFVRWTRGIPAQRAYLYLPDDPRLRSRAWQVAETRRHSLRRDRAGEGEPAPPVEASAAGTADGDGQLSLFAVISAVATGTETGDQPPPGVRRLDDGRAADPDDDRDLVVELPAIALAGEREPPAAGPGAGPRGGPGRGHPAPSGADWPPTRHERKRRLRDANAEVARALARRTGWPHAKVNAELNRLANVRRIDDATVEQLWRRLDQAERWYRRL